MSLFIFIYIVAQPGYVYAGFFSDLITKVFGSEIQTSKIVSPPDEDFVHNSQNVPLLESSINPDQKNIQDEMPVTIIEDETLVANTGPLGPNIDLSKYASSAKISTYIVKPGDTLEGIAKKFQISKSTILYSNADLKNDDLLKIGQSLTILPIKGAIYVVKKGDTLESIASKYKAEASDISDYNLLDKSSILQVGDSIIIPGGDLAQDSDKIEKPIVKKEVEKKIVEEKEVPVVKKDEPKVVVNIPPVVSETVQVPVPVTPPPVVAQVEVATPVETPADNGQPAGTISGGYIWPLPEGAGRISQGLHADQAYDFAAPKGTPIYAIQSGTVLIADSSGYNGGYGLYVVINFDDGGQAIFGHMSKVVAQAGQVVKRGEIIGYVGSTGKSTGNHVHIGYRGGKPNPYTGLKVNTTKLSDHD